jgi:hypothetical protein
MSDEESKAFVIRDKRGRGEDKVESPTAKPSSSSHSSSPLSKVQQDEPLSQTLHGHEHEAAPPVTFAGFIFSLSTSAMMLMGEQLDPQQGQAPVNLPQAKEIIDILSMLENKTQGNLQTDEQAVLTDMLYALRMKYVSMASGPHSS